MALQATLDVICQYFYDRLFSPRALKEKAQAEKLREEMKRDTPGDPKGDGNIGFKAPGIAAPAPSFSEKDTFLRHSASPPRARSEESDTLRSNASRNVGFGEGREGMEGDGTRSMDSSPKKKEHVDVGKAPPSDFQEENP